MKKLPLKAVLGLSLFSLPRSVSACTYVVKRGDTLSTIAAVLLGSPVYGSTGKLRAIIAKNPQITNPDLIFPGQSLDLDTPNLPGDRAAISETKPQAAEAAPPPRRREPAAEAPKKAQASASAVDEFSRFTLTGALNQSRIDSTDANSGGKSTPGSAVSPELKAAWEQHWESGLVSFLSAKMRFENFSTTSFTQTLSSHTPLELGFEAGAQLFSLGSRGSLTASLAYEADPFVRADSATDLTVDTVSVPKAHLGVDFALYQSHTFKLSAALGLAYLAPVSAASYRTDSGFAFDGALTLTQKRQVNPFFGGIRFEEENQNTSISKASYTSVGLVFGMSFDVKGNQP